jgi:4-hydroxybenzoyl-CoA reductase subunit beta
MNDIKFVMAESVGQASQFIKGHPAPGTMLMAGGTDLLVLKRHRLILPGNILYLKDIPGLAEIRPSSEGGLIIGALITLHELSRHPVIKEKYPMLAQAANSVASSQIRHKATLGGNICLNTRCWFYNRSPFWRAAYPQCRKASGGDVCYVVPKSRKGCFALQSGDTVGPLVALGANLRLVSHGGERIVGIEDFYLDDGIRHLNLKPGEILTEVLLPPPPGNGAFKKFRPQNNLDFATFTLAVVPPCKGTGSRIVVSCVASRPLRAQQAEAMLDQEIGDNAALARQAAQELPLVSLVRGSVEYKRQVIEAHLTGILSDLEKRASKQ